MQTLQRDIMTGLIFIIGIWCFISGQFIFSTLSFGIVAIYSNISRKPLLKG